MESRSQAWFGATFVTVVIALQIIRLHQSGAGSWIFWDYAGRIAALAILTAHPAARAIAFRLDKRQMPLWEIPVWIVGFSFVEPLNQRLAHLINHAFPMTVLGAYPRPSGWLYLFDLVFGLVLVVLTEEIVFRRCARHVMQPYLGDGIAMIAATSVVFGCYHWWSGLGTILSATIMGVLLMLMFKRSVALWPVAFAHYSVDIIAFT